MIFNVTFVTMLQVLHKILAIIIAFVILFSTLSFTVEKHVCMGEITDVSYFTVAETCGMTVEDCDIENPSETKIQQEKCCNNIQELIEGNQTEQQAIDSFELSQVQFVLAYTYSYLGLFDEYKGAIPFNDYNPPLVNKNIQVLYQTFLI